MNKDKVFLFLQAVLTIAGSFLVGKTIFGTAVDQSIWQTVLGGIMFVGSVIWGMVDHTATIEMFQSALRQVVSFGGGLLVASGKLKAETVVAIIGIVPMIAPIVYGWLSQLKSKRIASGTLGVVELAGVKTQEKTGIPVRPVATTKDTPADQKTVPPTSIKP